MTSELYEKKSKELPDVCFATRHPMISFLEQVNRQRAGEATEEDKKNNDLPDLEAMLPQLQFDESNVEAIPTYYARHVINDREQIFTASEA